MSSNNQWNNDPNNFLNSGGDGFGGQQTDGGQLGRTARDPSDVSTGQFGSRDQGLGGDSNLVGANRAGSGDPLRSQYNTTAGSGDTFGNTGYGNTTGTQAYGAGNVDQFPRSGAGTQDISDSRVGGGYGGLGNSDDNQYARSSGGVNSTGSRGFADNDQSQYGASGVAGGGRNLADSGDTQFSQSTTGGGQGFGGGSDEQYSRSSGGVRDDFSRGPGSNDNYDQGHQRSTGQKIKDTLKKAL